MPQEGKKFFVIHKVNTKVAFIIPLWWRLQKKTFFGNLIMKNAVATKPVMALPTIIMLGALGMTGAVSA
ncbi:MAG: hypothetical protein ACJA05_002345, partial [Porticoccus sp.]